MQLGGHRIIPAYAGSTPCTRGAGCSSTDHPRIRGEHRDDMVGDEPRHRIIPAYAGSTAAPTGTGVRCADHPRIRGEHANFPYTTFRACGSSPHTRGAPQRSSVCTGCRRIIPAYAGSTRIAVGRPRRAGDHPRIRGEHRRAVRDADGAEGSSPHTRGARAYRGAPVSPNGIIPAYAGSTRIHGHPLPQGADHPRIRGEHCPGADFACCQDGSSPHTRGAQVNWKDSRNGTGIIPAYAGSTAPRCPGSTTPRDHPRIRGEHILHDETQSGGHGSSPHTRGARLSNP